MTYLQDNFFRVFLFLGPFSLYLTSGLKCYSCIGRVCDDGECAGDYCMFKFDGKLSRHAFKRGCINVTTSSTSLQPIFAEGENLLCSALEYYGFSESTCICNKDFCNDHLFRFADHKGGKVDCSLQNSYYNYPRFVKGDWCVQTEVTNASQTAHSRFRLGSYQVGLLPSHFSGCLQIREDLTCYCRSGGNCHNFQLRQLTTRRDSSGPVTCKQCTFGSCMENCTGDACYIFANRGDDEVIAQGCVTALESSSLLPHCLHYTSQYEEQSSCLSVDSFSNTDLQAAEMSVNSSPSNFRFIIPMFILFDCIILA